MHREQQLGKLVFSKLSFIKNTKKPLLIVIFFVFLLFNSTAQINSEKKEKPKFANKIIHSFGLQYNNAFHAKGKFEYKNAPDYYIGGHSCISYGREYIVKYNLTFPSGWGITAEFVAGNRDFMTWRINGETGKRMYMYSLWSYSLRPFLDYTYYGGQIKASYMYRLHEKITIQPEVGIKLLKYVREIGWGKTNSVFEPDELGNPVLINQWRWFDLSNEYVPKRFIPELTAGINFLFHTKRDPRHNFVLGINGTLGFVDRYTGWQRFTPTEEIDVSMKYGSSFFALNLGYEFTGFKTPIYKTKEYRKARIASMHFETFDFSKPVHSVGIYFTSGFSLKARIKNKHGQFCPDISSSYVPELNLRYSLSIKNGLGFTVEIPIGLFNRNIYYPLGLLFSPDTVWANGNAIGSGISSWSTVSIPYIGATLKFSYFAQIHRNIFIQPEAGIKFMPFVFPVKSWDIESPIAENIHYIDIDGNTTDVIWLHDKPFISINHYAIPDITLAVNFMVHGKNPQHNFIFGINTNIGMMDRLSFNYHTTDVIPAHLQSSGKYGLKSSYIGFHVGYQFMTGKYTR